MTIHTAVPIGKDHVLFIQNGPEPLLRVVNIHTNETTGEFPLPVKNPKNTHGQFRHVRLTSAGTIMVAHMDLGKVSEYDSTGKELWSIPAPGVWEVTKADLPDYKFANLQLAWRLPNGDTMLNNWVNEWTGKIDRTTAPVQALEVTPEKKVVWALRDWMPPVDLGPATTIQLLDQPDAPENVSFGDMK